MEAIGSKTIASKNEEQRAFLSSPNYPLILCDNIDPLQRSSTRPARQPTIVTTFGSAERGTRRWPLD
jgi:hypothetical protein